MERVANRKLTSNCVVLALVNRFSLKSEAYNFKIYPSPFILWIAPFDCICIYLNPFNGTGKGGYLFFCFSSFANLTFSGIYGIKHAAKGGARGGTAPQTKGICPSLPLQISLVQDTFLFNFCIFLFHSHFRLHFFS